MKGYDNYNPDISVDHNSGVQGAPEDFSTYSLDDKPIGANGMAAAVEERKKRQRVNRANRAKTASKPARSKPDAKPFAQSFREFAQSPTLRYLIGILLLAVGVYLLISMISYIATGIADQSEVNGTAVTASKGIHNSGGEGGARISALLINDSFGLGAFVIIAWLAAMSIKLLFGSRVLRFKTVNFTIKCLVALITVSLIIGLVTIGVDADFCWGGYHGEMVNAFIIEFFGWAGAAVLCIFMLAVFFIICMRDLIKWIIGVRRKRAQRKAREAELRRIEEEKIQALAEQEARDREDDARTGYAPVTDQEENEEDARVTFSGSDLDPIDSELDMNSLTYGEADRGTAEKTAAEPASDASDTSMEAEESDGETPADTAEEKAEVMRVNVNRIGIAADPEGRPERFDPRAELSRYTFPSYSLLRPGNPHIAVDQEEQLENKEKIRSTLLNFGIPILSIEATVGPTVTLYEIVPDKGVKLSRITSLVDDIAMSLAATGVRIIAPIPGKGTVGIEVANKEPQIVSMQTVITSRRFQENHYELPVAIGTTISNEVYIADLAKMPHLLVAGATGQGKSVGLNAIITSLLYSKHPTELKFVMIDPKMVEFSIYSQLENHYLAEIPGQDEPIITDSQKVVEALSSLCEEMDNRYKLIKKSGLRNIKEYNAKFISKALSPDDGHYFMPYIVVVVDEFSDLMMMAGKDVEMPIARLAQKGRAAGLHVIIATQRPSTNVITGIIKANFPARIAFKVSSGVDSKTILDTTGAQQLIGRGDMLISNSSEITRVQCAFIDTPEVEAICGFISSQPGLAHPYVLPEPNLSQDSESTRDKSHLTERDPLFEEAARMVVLSNNASTSSLQRRYAIGYNRAGKIMDQLEAAGVVGPAHGGKPRDVLVTPEQLEKILNS